MSHAHTISENLPKPHRCPWILHYALVSPLRRLFEPAEALVGAHIEPGMIVAEPGCGFGYFTLPMARLVGEAGRVIALDISPKVVARMERRAARAGLLERVEGRTCDAGEMGLEPGSVDFIPVIHTLHEIEALDEFIRQAFEALKPGGRMLIVEPQGHVTREAFEAEVALCQRLGFQALETPKSGRSRLISLLERPVE